MKHLSTHISRKRKRSVIIASLVVVCLVLPGLSWALVSQETEFDIPNDSSKTTVNETKSQPKDNNVTPAESTPAEARTSIDLQPQCVDSDIPYSTVQKDAPWIMQGKSEILKGTSGKKRVCSNSEGVISSTVIVSPTDAIVYVGSKLAPPPSDTSPQYTFDQALSLARETCRLRGYAPDSTDMADCKTQEMAKYGY